MLDEQLSISEQTQPLFAQGGLRARYQIAKVSQEQALVACETSREKSTLLEKQVASLEKAYESTFLLMTHGNITYLDVLTACQSLLGAKLQQSGNRFKEIQSVINLYQALKEVRIKLLFIPVKLLLFI